MPCDDFFPHYFYRWNLTPVFTKEICSDLYLSFIFIRLDIIILWCSKDALWENVWNYDCVLSALIFAIIIIKSTNASDCLSKIKMCQYPFQVIWSKIVQCLFYCFCHFGRAFVKKHHIRIHVLCVLIWPKMSWNNNARRYCSAVVVVTLSINLVAKLSTFTQRHNSQ